MAIWKYPVKYSQGEDLLKIQSVKNYHRNKCELSDEHILTLIHSAQEVDQEM
jgi:hypothetical protein